MAWEAYALTAAFISVLIAALLLMLSRIFDFKALEQSAKSELVFAASSVIVALVLIGLVNFGAEAGKNIAAEMYIYTYQHAAAGSPDYLYYTDENGVKQQLTPAMFSDRRYTLSEIVILYMKSTMYCAESVGSKAFKISMVAHEISSISQDVFMAYPMSAWSWGGIAQAMDNLLNTIYFLELVFHLEVYVLRFMDVFSVAYLIPIGIVMRAFPPTRGAGAYVIAFGVGLYLVFPMAYLAAVFSSPYPNLCATPQIPDPASGENSKAGIVGELIMWYRAFEGNILDMMSKLSDLSNALLMNLCFFPFLAFAITITVMQFTSGLFGANINEIGRGLIKLI